MPRTANKEELRTSCASIEGGYNCPIPIVWVFGLSFQCAGISIQWFKHFCTGFGANNSTPSQDSDLKSGFRSESLTYQYLLRCNELRVKKGSDVKDRVPHYATMQGYASFG